MELSTSQAYFEEVASILREDGHEADVLHEVDIYRLPDISHDLVVSHVGFQPGWQPRTGWYGGQPMSRAESLRFLEDAGMPTMEWATAETRQDVAGLFATWETEWILMKRSSSYRRKGTTLLHHHHVGSIDWTPNADVFCRVIDLDDQEVYKTEIMAGEVVFISKATFPPLTPDLAGTPLGEVTDFERIRVELPPEVAERAASVSSTLMDQHYGYCGIDIMRHPNGEYVAIELNLGAVGLSFSSQFDDAPSAYADGIRRLIDHREGAHLGYPALERFDVGQVEYRKARFGEIRTLVPLARELVGAATDRQLEKRLRRLILRRGYSLYVLTWEKQVIALAIFRLGYFLGADVPYVQVIGLVVDPRFRGHGISATLIGLLSQESVKRGYCQLWFLTQQESLIEFYEGLGFDNSGYLFTLPLPLDRKLPLRRRIVRRLGI